MRLVGEGVARATHGAHGIGLLPPDQGFAQAPDMDVDGSLIDIDIAAPYAVEKLVAAESDARCS